MSGYPNAGAQPVQVVQVIQAPANADTEKPFGKRDPTVVGQYVLRDIPYETMDCCAAKGTFLKACFCPCLVSGQIAEHTGDDSGCMKYCGVACISQGLCCDAYHALVVSQDLRKQYGMDTQHVRSLFMSTFCGPCELTREARFVEDL